MKIGGSSLRANDFFDRIVYINPCGENMLWPKVKQQCALRGIALEKVQGDDPKTTLIPPDSFFTVYEAAEVFSFYKVIRQAYLDRINRVLILSGNLKLVRSFPDALDAALSGLPHEWDLLYLGHQSCQPFATYDVAPAVQRAHSAVGHYALAINNSFYPLFLEATRNPVSSLNQYLSELSTNINIFVVTPPIVVTA